MGVAVRIQAGPTHIPVRVWPRVRDGAGAAVRVEVAVADALQRGVTFIGLLGAAGSGRTTALAVVQKSLARDDIEYVDDVARAEIAADSLALGKAARVFTADVSTESELDGVANTSLLRLHDWGLDELVEWSLGEPESSRRGFVERATRAHPGLSACPAEVLAAVWTAFGTHPELTGASIALLQAVADAGVDAGPDSAVAETAVKMLLTDPDARVSTRPAWRGLLRHGRVVEAICLRRLRSRLEAGQTEELGSTWPDRLRERLGRTIAADPACQESLERALDADTNSPVGANAVSLLRYAGSAWRPKAGRVTFARAFLARAPWAGVRLPQACLASAQVAQADLAGAFMPRMNAEGTVFDRAKLQGAVLERARCLWASFRSSDLRGANLQHARLDSACLLAADLSGADLRWARLISADLGGARLVRANLDSALLNQTGLQDANLMGATLRGTRARHVDFRSCAFDGVDLSSADLAGCSVEELTGSGIRAEFARFAGCDFTGSVFKNLSMPHATFAGCGLAEVWWPGADLQGVDFSGSTFHMGSSRSGLVNSTIASEGSRTGFYADESSERGYRPPEEISKADLRGADLRGAVVHGTDFYLVDLRGALLDDPQRAWLRSCGAILDERLDSRGP